jgi:hypothetical protein
MSKIVSIQRGGNGGWFENPNSRREMTTNSNGAAQLITWEGQDGWQYQAFGVDLKLEEGPDPLQFTREGWRHQERQ